MNPEPNYSFVTVKIFSAYFSLALLMLFSACASQKKGYAKRNSKKTYYHSRQATRHPEAAAAPASQPAAPATPARAADPEAELSRRELRALNKTDAQITNLISKARSFTGVPYAWGGTTRSGMDCSGLLYTTFQACGLSIPRTSQEQSKTGKNIMLYELRPGDFVFFAAQKGNPNKITHVGMVTEVLDKHNVQFIHASTKLGVVENNIFSDYYRRIFVKARRLF